MPEAMNRISSAGTPEVYRRPLCAGTRYFRAAPKKDELVCLIPDWDPWMQNMLRPLVEAAGYRVVDDAENENADVVIACLGEELPEDASHKTIWLRTEPEAASKKDFSIYRYDRAGLLMALKSAGAGRGK